MQIRRIRLQDPQLELFFSQSEGTLTQGCFQRSGRHASRQKRGRSETARAMQIAGSDNTRIDCEPASRRFGPVLDSLSAGIMI